MFNGNFQQPIQPQFPTSMYGSTPQMQQRLMQMEQQQVFSGGTPQPYTVCNIVSSVEEAKAREIIPNGTSYFFPSPSENRIYEKSTGMDGQQIFKAYELIELPNVMPATTGSVKALEDRIASLESLFKEYMMGGKGNVQSDANVRDAHAVSKTNGNVSANGRK